MYSEGHPSGLRNNCAQRISSISEVGGLSGWQAQAQGLGGGHYPVRNSTFSQGPAFDCNTEFPQPGSMDVTDLHDGLSDDTQINNSALIGNAGNDAQEYVEPRVPLYHLGGNQFPGLPLSTNAQSGHIEYSRGYVSGWELGSNNTNNVQATLSAQHPFGQASPVTSAGSMRLQTGECSRNDSFEHSQMDSMPIVGFSYSSESFETRGEQLNTSGGYATPPTQAHESSYRQTAHTADGNFFSTEHPEVSNACYRRNSCGRGYNAVNTGYSQTEVSASTAGPCSPQSDLFHEPSVGASGARPSPVHWCQDTPTSWQSHDSGMRTHPFVAPNLSPSRGAIPVQKLEPYGNYAPKLPKKGRGSNGSLRKRIRHLTPEQRRHAGGVRKIGACETCRFQKIKVCLLC